MSNNEEAPTVQHLAQSLMGEFPLCTVSNIV